MSDPGETEESERLSDLDDIAAALRAGKLDPVTRFARRRSEQRPCDSTNGGGTSPDEILRDVRSSTSDQEDAMGKDESEQADEEVEVGQTVVINGERVGEVTGIDEQSVYVELDPEIKERTSGRHLEETEDSEAYRVPTEYAKAIDDVVQITAD